jgi:hypothetical protein
VPFILSWRLDRKSEALPRSQPDAAMAPIFTGKILDVIDRAAGICFLYEAASGNRAYYFDGRNSNTL